MIFDYPCALADTVPHGLITSDPYTCRAFPSWRQKSKHNHPVEPILASWHPRYSFQDPFSRLQAESCNVVSCSVQSGECWYWWSFWCILGCSQQQRWLKGLNLHEDVGIRFNFVYVCDEYRRIPVWSLPVLLEESPVRGFISYCERCLQTCRGGGSQDVQGFEAGKNKKQWKVWRCLKQFLAWSFYQISTRE